MSTPSQVNQLPQRLRNFFAKYPPQLYSAAVAPRPTPPETETPAEETLPSPYTPDRYAKGAHRQDVNAWSPSKALLCNNSRKALNPFLPQKFNGRWSGPRYSLRQQADLVKLAIKYNIEELLPLGRKSSEYKATRLAERGLRIKGTGIGQKVKGHKWERTMETRLEERRKAMGEMPEMIRLWKQVSYLWAMERNLLTRSPERSWSWLEKVAQAVNVDAQFQSSFLLSAKSLLFLGTARSTFVRDQCRSLRGLAWEFIVHFRYYLSSVLYCMYSRTLLVGGSSCMISSVFI